MLGAIIGDIVGSPYETCSAKKKDFTWLHARCRPTDDSIMTIAVGCAIADSDYRDEAAFKQSLAENFRQIGLLYPDAGYGQHFYQWLITEDAAPYGSYGNGSAMRVSPVAWAAESLEEALLLAKWSAEITHDHPEGIRGAQAVAAAIYLARTGHSKQQIRSYVQEHFYDLSFTLDQIRPAYRFDVSCQGSVPQAIVCFLEAENFEDAVRNAVSLGGDGDTQAAIAGSIAEAYFGIPEALQEEIFDYLDETLQDYYFSYAQALYG